MRVFRELTHDDPHRKSTRSRGANPTKDEGDLFTRRPSSRKLRVLLDVETLSDKRPWADEHLRALLKYDNVEGMLVAMSKVTQKWTDDMQSRPGYVQVCDTTDKQGSSSYPGPRYSWKIKDPSHKFDGSTTLERSGGFSPEQELIRAKRLWNDGAFDGLKVTEDDLSRAVLLTELARDMDYDLVISESATADLAVVPANDRVNVVTRAQAVPIIAHYLRTQQHYLVNAVKRVEMGRRDYFAVGVGALAEGIVWWQGKCHQARLHSDDGERFVDDAATLVDRLSRALRSRDALIASIGAIQTRDVIDDGADALDHCLVCLCGAVDVLARSLHVAQQLPGEERFAKLHPPNGYRALVDAYGDADGIDELETLQRRLNVVFSLRNSIHSRALAAIASLRQTPMGIPAVNVGQIDIVIPTYAAAEMNKDQSGGLDFWDARHLVDDIVVVDLMTLVDRCFRVTLEFLDHLCRMISATSILDKDPVLTLPVTGIRRDVLDFPQEMRVYLGLPTDDATVNRTHEDDCITKDMVVVPLLDAAETPDC
jgi:hypothetical protein